MNKIVSAIKAKPKWFMSAVGLGVIAIGVYIAFREWDRISRVLTQADIGTLAIAGLLTVASYLLFLVGFIYVHRLFDFTLPVTSLSLIGFVSSAMNHLLPLASIGEYSLRIYFLRQRGYSVKDSVTVSVIHSYFHNSILFVLFPIFAAYVMFTHPPGSTSSAVLVFSSLVSIAVFAIATTAIFHSGGRQKIFDLLGKVSSFAHLHLTDEIQRLVEYFENARSTLVEKTSRFAGVVAIVTVEWLISALILNYCFEALGYNVPLSELMVGFILGTSMGLFSLLPSGIGVQEGTMALAFIALGVPFEYAFLAPILYRAIYYFLPSVLSLALYWLLLRGDQPEESTNLLGNESQD